MYALALSLTRLLDVEIASIMYEPRHSNFQKTYKRNTTSCLHLQE